MISIHAPREGCDPCRRGHGRHGMVISIHAPREGCDTTSKPTFALRVKFQSTHPVRGATKP